jgi:hypothetical protein
MLRSTSDVDPLSGIGGTVVQLRALVEPLNVRIALVSHGDRLTDQPWIAVLQLAFQVVGERGALKLRLLVHCEAALCEGILAVVVAVTEDAVRLRP